MQQFGKIYNNRRVLVTGHTGFKGSWLSLWLQELGAIVSGLALAPDTHPNHWELLKLDMQEDRADIRDSAAVAGCLDRTRPEIVFHLAAQPLVRRSYQDPLETWSTNVIGTANLLEACRNTPGVRAVLVITTDKVYDNNEWPWGYRETDRLGGHDPYSASKAATELVANSFRKSFFNTLSSPLLATARAGNVIGGSDWSEDRLIPDLIRAVQSGSSLEIRSPKATRPWQHVLECLSGYLLLGQKLLEGYSEFADAWNFGPEQDSNRTVADVLAGLKNYWPQINWHQTSEIQPHEANLLYLDSAKAKRLLGWQPVWTLEDGLSATVEWYSAFIENNRVLSRQQLTAFVKTALDKGLGWVAE
ncbi:MAG: CDP-glucose 4,6-dehydratase [Desulfuromonadales bacterium]|nr:MAG: CDP-glucose 4,6-dehydratase [Desulfuromonadales bacterium]